MDERQERILEYFWDPKNQRVRDIVPKSLIYYFEGGQYYDIPIAALAKTTVDVTIIELTHAGYIQDAQIKDPTHRATFEKEEFLTVTARGMAWLKDAHPTVLMYWNRILELTPAWASLAVAAIGLVASVFGIIQFGVWVKSL